MILKTAHIFLLSGFCLFGNHTRAESDVQVQERPMQATVVQEQTKQQTLIALVTIEGHIDKSKPIVSLLRQLTLNQKVNGLLLHIDSRGGCGGSSEAIHRAIKEFKKNKPVVVWTESACLSGAYEIASAADYICSLSCSEIGNIGVVYNVNKYKNVKFTENGRSGDVETIIVAAGADKALKNPYMEFKEEHQVVFKKEVDSQYQMFVKSVAQARSLSLDNEKEWANGKIFNGEDALQLGLVDAIGGFDDALIKMKELLQSRGIIVEGELEIIDHSLNNTAKK